MRPENRENDMLEQLLQESLASSAVPSDDFTQRLMDRVRCTPQEKKRIALPNKKLLATIAACAVIAAAIPLVMSGGGFGTNNADSASADCAIPMESNGGDDSNDSDGDALTESDFTYADQDAGDALMAESTEDKMSGDSEVPQSRESARALTLTGQEAQNAAAVLEAMDVMPESTEEDRVTYTLTAGQAQALADTVEVLYTVEDDVVLVLIWEEAE